MPEYLSPGVYIEEVPSGPVPIEGVSTSTAGFVGQTLRGPTSPRLVTSFADYNRLYGPPTNIETSFLGFGVQGFFGNGGTRAFVARVTSADAESAILTVGDLAIETVGPGLWGNLIYVEITDGSLAKGPGQSPFKLRVALFDKVPKTLRPSDRDNYVPPSVDEVFDNLSIKPSDPTFAGNVINGVSVLITVGLADNTKKEDELARPENKPFLEGSGEDQKDSGEQLHLDGGANGAKPALADYKGHVVKDGKNLPPEQQTGLAGISHIREVSILVVPDHHDVPGLTNLVVTQCETLTDRFAVLHYSESDNNSIATQAVPMDSSYGAVYAPWIRIPDMSDPSGKATLVIPPSGHVAGVYARTDVERGVHKAPANEVLRGPTLKDQGPNKPLVPMINRGLQDILNPKNINCVRDFRSEGRGVRVWGSRTMSSNGQWRYVPVRRLFIFVEQSVELATQWVVFEPNSEFTWIRVVASVSNFLGTVWRSGALFGATPQEAYFVKCDMTTMTPDDIDNGRLICLVGIAPVKPAEFVIFRFSQKTIEAQS